MKLSTYKNCIGKSAKAEEVRPLFTPWGERIDPDHVLEEYPRPSMVRDNYTILNGYWNFRVLKLKTSEELMQGKILVPFSPEAPLSEAGFQLRPNQYLICERDFDFPDLKEGERCILHFGAVDQHAKVFVNDHNVINHTGGYLPFSIDITDSLISGINHLSVQIEDRSDTSYHSIGKQKLKRGGMFYTAQSGIWQTVWYEVVPCVYIKDLVVTPCFDHETVHVQLTLNRPLYGTGTQNSVYCHVVDASNRVLGKTVLTNHHDNLTSYSGYCDVDHMNPWSPEDPYLYSLYIHGGKDFVTSYFGMRIFSIEPDEMGHPRFCLNHKPYFLNGVLDQGYWPDGLYTAPSDEAMIYDIEKMKELGFNLLRKHVKLEPDRWYYHCDRLGMIVWQDMVNGGGYQAPFMTWLPTVSDKFKGTINDHNYPFFCRSNSNGRNEFINECLKTIQKLKNFTCISTWVLFNEGWGQFDSTRLTDLMHSWDPTRLIDSASGWFDQGQGDFKSIHNYFKKQFVDLDSRAFVISEFGGYACPVSDHVSTDHLYGYKVFETVDDLQSSIRELFDQEITPLKKEGLSGVIYTQLSDIEDETNGILTYDRKICKLDKINES